MRYNVYHMIGCQCRILILSVSNIPTISNIPNILSIPGPELQV